MMKKLPGWAIALLFILLCNSAGIIGSIFTFEAIPNWYASLEKPSFSPPNWLFGPVWTALYTLMGISAFLVWQKGLERKEVRFALGIFAIQLALNALWSILFFGLKSPLLAFIEIIFLWISIIASIYIFYKIDRRAAALLVPYILWVSFAALLNFSIWMLNG